MIGTTLSHFKITAKLGEGGMGEVYRAEDTKLGREVAIKVLPETVATDPERLARFEREAKVLASLNHSHIAAIYGLEEDRGRHALVMELVEGEDLKGILDGAPISAEEALPIGLQIAEAIEAAHEQGIVHRDLKPANVMVDESGQVKVLDFGLAKALEGDSDSMIASGLSMSPTLTAQMTGAGVILGTAAYMSPEQARGKRVDRRTDIWAFGCVLFEMLSGSPAFGGETVTDILGAIVHKEPDWSVLPEDTARPIRGLLERCLEKDPRRRLQAVGEARLLLERLLEDPESLLPVETPVPSESAGRSRWRRFLPWALAGALAIALGFAHLQPSAEGPRLHVTIPPPAGQIFHLDPYDPGPVALSPDGTKLAFSARNAEGEVQLWVRSLDAAQAYLLTGTDGAQYPFWSPDGKWIGFFTKVDRTLKKISSAGGPPVTLCAAHDGKGGSWNEDGIIIFAPDVGTGIHRVPAAGGDSSPVTAREDEARFDSHRHPRFLPDGRHFLFLARAPNLRESRLMLGSMAGEEEPRELVASYSQGEFADGHLFFVRDRTLMVQPFDERRLELVGEAAPVAEKVIHIEGSGVSVFSVSQGGVLAYQMGDTFAGAGLELFDRDGEEVRNLGDVDSYLTAILSPDGHYAVVAIESADSITHDLWLVDIERDVSTRLTFGAADEPTAAWMPDSRSLIYSSVEGDVTRFFRIEIGGVGDPELLHELDLPARPNSVSPDGRYLAYHAGIPGETDLWILPLENSAEARVFRQTEFDEAYARFSPDGRWLAYIANESGRLETYVEAFPGPGRRFLISTDSGVYPFWREDGGEILYHELGGQVMVVDVEALAEDLRVGVPRGLFMTDQPSWNGTIISPTPDLEQILVAPRTDQQADTLLNLVVNWPAILEQP